MHLPVVGENLVKTQKEAGSTRREGNSKGEREEGEKERGRRKKEKQRQRQRG